MHQACDFDPQASLKHYSDYNFVVTKFWKFSDPAEWKLVALRPPATQVSRQDYRLATVPPTLRDGVPFHPAWVGPVAAKIAVKTAATANAPTACNARFAISPFPLAIMAALFFDGRLQG